jgi:hypothetical protein
MTRYRISIVLAGLATIAAIAPAQAADNVMKVCGAKYQAAKTAKTLPAGETWMQFLAACRASTAPAAAPATAKPVAAPVAAAPAKPSIFSHFTKPAVAAAPAAAPAPASRASHLPGAQSPAMVAMHDRQRQCGAQWKADKAAGKIPAGQTWPKYWSACNTRLKG